MKAYGTPLDSEFQEYLRRKRSGKTVSTYGAAFRRFMEHYREKYGADQNIRLFLERVFDNMRKPIEEKQPGLIEGELADYIVFLKKAGKSDNTARVYVAAMQNFFKFYNIPVSMTFVGNLPKAVTKKENLKHEWTREEVKTFLGAAETYRDKALIMCIFQSGMGVSDISGLDYGDIKDEYEKGIIPIHLRLNRVKTGVPFRTFFGRDAVHYLQLYLQTRRNLRPESPLFTKWSSEDERITPGAIQKKFFRIAETVDFILEEDLENGMNPARPHSLRAAFRSQLTGKVSDTLIEFWMGHAIGEEKRAYLNMATEEMRELYMDWEKYLAVEKTSRDEKAGLVDVEAKTKEVIAELTEENKALRKRIDRLEDKQEHILKDLGELRKLAIGKAKSAT